MACKAFNINSLAYDIKRLVEYLINHERAGKRIKEEINYFKQLKDGLQSKDSNNPNYREVFALLLETIITQSWYYSLKEDEGRELYDLVHYYGVEGLTLGEGMKRLLELISRIESRRKRRKVKDKIIRLLDELQSVKLHEWVKELYDLARNGETKILGVKGRDNFLRDVGYWDRIPIDRHEARFIIRTGIFHACSLSNKVDPLNKDHLQDALRAFCKNYLEGFKVLDIDLGNAPGILDIFIWHYCKETPEGLSICGRNPKCNECFLRNSCLFSINRRGG